jgi:dipeptidyl aminopeptidase/acylaminoacyl peptidase
MIGCAATLLVLALAPDARAGGAPTIDQMVSLRRVASPVISPDGARVAFTVRDTDWVGNAFPTQIWVADVGGGEPRQLTQGPKANSAPAWSPGGDTLAFVSERGEKRQVYLLDMRGGDAWSVTSADEGVTRFEWSPDGTRIAWSATEPKSKAQKDREKRLGEVDVVNEDFRMTHLWVTELASKSHRQITRGDFSVGGFSWSPDGKRIAFDHQINPRLAADSTTDLSVVEVAGGKVHAIVAQKGPDSGPVWSPDGSRIAFETAMGDPWYYYANTRIAAVPSTGGPVEALTSEFDEDANLVDWGPSGLFFSASERTSAYLYRLDPATRRISRVAPAADWAGASFSFDRDFTATAYVGSDAAHYPEVYVARIGPVSETEAGATRLTRMGDQLSGWQLGTSEVVRWTSRDGASIEGVLRKPEGLKPGRRAPLIVVIHGGPTAVSRPSRFAATYVYPVEQWLARGALVLEPNYRGSAGYGAAFRALNVRNLGVGDAWDVMSGIDALVARGLADSARVGVCGWSQGGYISAFLATHESRRFRAISVGAGISDWMTYYVNTDITPFTRQYLKSTPWSDPAVYARTSPITTVTDATAPTLIQQGENDARVPPPNAYELYRALQDLGVPSRLVVYKGYGHGLNKPKAVRAALEHNLEWFDRWLFARTGPTSPSARSRAAEVTGNRSEH